MTTSRAFVLVHGAWHGGWCWSRVRDRLAADGHRVFTPTLSGLADRSHLLGSGIDLNTHIDDVSNLLAWEDLTDVILVGHSYGGWVISGAVEKQPDRIDTMVFVDALVPENGQRLIDQSQVDARNQIAAVQRAGRYGRPSPPASYFGVKSPDDQRWVESRLTDQPIGVSQTAISLTGARERVRRRLYVRAMDDQSPLSPRFREIYSRLNGDPGWDTVAVANSGHDIMIDAPGELYEVLRGLA